MYMTCLADYLYPLINESSAHQREFAGDIISPVLQRNTQKNSQVFKVQDRKPRLLGALEGWAAGTSSSHGWEINVFYVFLLLKRKWKKMGKCMENAIMCSICVQYVIYLCVQYVFYIKMIYLCVQYVSFYLAIFECQRLVGSSAAGWDAKETST